MNKTNICNDIFPSRFLIVILGLVLCMAIACSAPGCSTFKGKKTDSVPTKEKTAFDSARDEHENLAEYVASAGRKNPKEKKEIDPGQTFLLSDKAKEIYRNTER